MIKNLKHVVDTDQRDLDNADAELNNIEDDEEDEAEATRLSNLVRRVRYVTNSSGAQRGHKVDFVCRKRKALHEKE